MKIDDIVKEFEEKYIEYAYTIEMKKGDLGKWVGWRIATLIESLSKELEGKELSHHSNNTHEFIHGYNSALSAIQELLKTLI